MALKFEIDNLDGLDDAIKALYVEKNGKYQLAVDGVPQAGDDSGLKAKVDQLLAEKKAEAEKRRAAEEAERTALEEKARASGDNAALLKSAQERIAAMEAQAAASSALAAQNEVARVSMEISAKISDGANQKILSRFIADRLKFGDNGIVVTDANGNPTISTVEQLQEEFKSSAEFASLVTASKGSGGGAAGSGGAGGASKKLSEMNEAERVALAKSNPEAFAALI